MQDIAKECCAVKECSFINIYYINTVLVLYEGILAYFSCNFEHSVFHVRGNINDLDAECELHAASKYYNTHAYNIIHRNIIHPSNIIIHRNNTIVPSTHRSWKV